MPIEPTDLITKSQALLLNRAAAITAEQLTQAEDILDSRLPQCVGELRATMIVSVAQVMATNYLAQATLRTALASNVAR